jgi:hypothetical protein
MVSKNNDLISQPQLLLHLEVGGSTFVFFDNSSENHQANPKIYKLTFVV